MQNAHPGERGEDRSITQPVGVAGERVNEEECT